MAVEMEPEEIFAEPTQRYEQKRRRCLRCQDEFDSEWVGDRICGRCKQSSAWRAGQPFASPGSRVSTGRGSGK
jgi:hypothetical protein